MNFRSKSNLYQRITLSSIASAIILLAIYLSSHPYFQILFFLLISAFVTGALWEYYQIAKYKNFEPLEKTGIFCSLAYLTATFLTTQHVQLAVLPEIFLWATLVICFATYMIYGHHPLSNCAATLFGIAYLTVPLAYLLKKFSHKNKKLAPYISPSKTCEGAIGGLMASISMSFLSFLFFNYCFANPPILLSLFSSIALGISISLVAQFGDLAESLLKRDASVKDSNQLPGFGGILDIVDSTIFVAPLLYFFLKLNFKGTLL